MAGRYRRALVKLSGEALMGGRSFGIDPPTVSVRFSVNTSPFSGREGRFLTSRQIGDRLRREALGNVAIRIEPTDSPDVFEVAGRGELQIAVLIETMRREGYEFSVSQPEIIVREIDGKRCEPVEDVVAEVPDEYSGTILEKPSSNSYSQTYQAQIAQDAFILDKQVTNHHHRRCAENSQFRGQRRKVQGWKFYGWHTFSVKKLEVRDWRLETILNLSSPIPSLYLLTGEKGEPINQIRQLSRSRVNFVEQQIGEEADDKTEDNQGQGNPNLPAIHVSETFIGRIEGAKQHPAHRG